MTTKREPDVGTAKTYIANLAAILYDGDISNLAETLARDFGEAGALTFFNLMGEDVQNFWLGIAKQLIDHAKEWKKNQGPCCVLSEREAKRLAELPRVFDIVDKEYLENAASES